MPEFVGQAAVKFEPQHYSPEYDIGNSGSGTVTIDWNNGNCQNITMTGDCLFGEPSNPKAGAQYLLRLIEDATGGRVPTWDAAFIWVDDGVPPVLGGSNTVDIVGFSSDGVNLYGRYNQTRRITMMRHFRG